jgi:phosphotransferase system enzyme I (PtsI)
MTEKDQQSIILHGLPASPGIVIGEAYVITPIEPKIVRREILRGDVEREICRFKEAIEQTRAQIMEMKGGLERKLGEKKARIFDSHLLILEDVLAFDRTIEMIRNENVTAEYAFSRAMSEVIEALMDVESRYLRDRVGDLKDVQNRIIHNLSGFGKRIGLKDLKKRCVIVAHELSPSMTARADRHQLLGIVTDLSGTTSHAAILAQAFEIPAVVGLEDSTDYRFREIEDELARLRDLPATTIDGYRIVLAANIEFPEEILSVRSHGAGGVGLFRTEYLFLTRKTLPTEEEQFTIYRDILEGIKPAPVVIRTFDVGADKRSDLFDIPHEKNPFLGWRGVRLALDSVDIFITHLRALLRASPFGNLHIMFPMVNSIEELRRLYALLQRVEEDLRREGHEVNSEYQRGIMIETPASVLLADLLADEVDFFSIGTNDLIQYLLAVDRGNERVAHLYDPFHPAVIRSIQDVLKQAKNRRKWVGVCGEMAGHSPTALLLIGLGIDELSTSPILVPKIKRLVRGITITEARDLSRESLKLKTAEEIRSVFESFIRDRFGEVF